MRMQRENTKCLVCGQVVAGYEPWKESISKDRYRKPYLVSHGPAIVYLHGHLFERCPGSDNRADSSWPLEFAVNRISLEADALKKLVGEGGVNKARRVAALAFDLNQAAKSIVAALETLQNHADPLLKLRATVLEVKTAEIMVAAADKAKVKA